MANRRVRRTKNFAAYLSAINQDISRIDSKPRLSGTADGIVSGSTLSSSVVLDNNFIQSGNYLPGLTGWKIDSNGVAEFSDIYVRGHIDAQTGSIGYWNISTPVVDRTFGGRTLFGTFLESRDLGISDNTQTKGSYVGLFKSYSEEGVAITHKYRVNNVATITAPDHGFENGDYLTVRLDDGDDSFSTGESNVRIFNVTKDTFSYANQGDDFTFVADGDIQDNSTYGTATLYIKDVAGLYLQDYGKALFDYGYFSNEGIAYVSAETPNLVYNASFEYIDEDSVTQASFDSHIGGYSFYLPYAFSTEDKYNGDSVYAMQLLWNDSELDTYYHLKVNSSEFKRLDFYKNNRELYLNFDMFYDMPINKIAIPATDSFFVEGGDITIVCPGHGLQIGDFVFLDFTAYDGAGFFYNDSKIKEVVDVDGDSFFLNTSQIYNGPYDPITLTRLYSTSGPFIFKYTHAMLDLNDVKISFVTDGSDPENLVLDSTTSLTDVITDVTLANWDDHRYWTPSTSEFENWYRFTDYFSTSPFKTYRPVGSMGVQSLESEYNSTRTASQIKISSSKIESYYRKIAPESELSAGGSVGSEFYLSIPEWLWESRIDPAPALPPTKLDIKAKGGYLIDNVFISPSSKFFFGDSGSSSFYYKLTADDQVKTNKVSYESPRQWLDIDLEFQTAQLKYVDSIEFKSSDFLKQLYVNPGINTVKSGSTPFGAGGAENLLIGESSVVNITSGQYRYLDASSEYKTLEAFSTQETGVNSAVYEIKARSSAVGALESGAASGSSLSLSVDSGDKGHIESNTDYLTMYAKERINLFLSAATLSVLEMSPNGFLAYTDSNAPARMASGGLDVQVLGDSGIFFRSEFTNYFGMTNDIKIYAQPITNNDLTSSYESVYISTLDNTLGYVSSSITTKKNVEPLQLSIDSILAAEPVQFNYKSEEDGSPKHAGFIAEQLVDAGLGNYVSFDADGNPRSINYEMFVSALQSVVRSQASQITNLEDRINRLENGNV